MCVSNQLQRVYKFGVRDRRWFGVLLTLALDVGFNTHLPFKKLLHGHVLSAMCVWGHRRLRPTLDDR